MKGNMVNLSKIKLYESSFPGFGEKLCIILGICTRILDSIKYTLGKHDMRIPNSECLHHLENSVSYSSMIESIEFISSCYRWLRSIHESKWLILWSNIRLTEIEDELWSSSHPFLRSLSASTHKSLRDIISMWWQYFHWHITILAYTRLKYKKTTQSMSDLVFTCPNEILIISFVSVQILEDMWEV